MNQEPKKKGKQGFASMDKNKQLEIAKKGGESRGKQGKDKFINKDKNEILNENNKTIIYLNPKNKR
jgi:general stress protein YciG